jgi:hypothetical protein
MKGGFSRRLADGDDPQRANPVITTPIACASDWGGDVLLSAFASERDSSPARSQALFEPMVGIRLVVEGFHFLVSAVSVQLDGFNEGAVRFQVKNRNSRFPCVALQSLNVLKQ